MAAPRRVDNDDLARLIRQVQESVWDRGWKVRETTFFANEDLVSDPDLVPTFQSMDGLFLFVVNVKGRTAMRSDLDDEVVKRPAGLFARDLENQIAARTRLEPMEMPTRVGRNFAKEYPDASASATECANEPRPHG